MTTVALYSGASKPGLFELSPAESSAIVLLEPGLGPPAFFCTGTHLGNGWVLTASHCALGGGMFLRTARDPDRFIAADRLEHEGSIDALLVHFPDAARSKIGHIPLFEMDIDETWIGERVMLAGYGEQRNGEVRQLQFVTEGIERLEETSFVVGGQGRSGACFGDSGGPALVVGDDGRARVLGTLSTGDSSCLEQDEYVHSALVRKLADKVTIPPPAPPTASCGALTDAGTCRAQTALFCAGGRAVHERCAEDAPCTWSSEHEGYRCTPAAKSPCRGLTELGECDGDVVHRCERGQTLTIDCASCSSTCGFDRSSGRADCVPE